MNASASAWRDLGRFLRIASTIGASETVSSLAPFFAMALRVTLLDESRLAGSALAAVLAAAALRLVLMATEVPMKEGPRSWHGPGDTVQYGLFAGAIRRG